MEENENSTNKIDYKELASFIVEELIKLNVLRKGNSTFKNTESLLYKYNDLKKSIVDRQEEISEIENIGLPSKSKSIFKISEGKHIDNEDLKLEVITILEKECRKTQMIINRIDRILSKFKDDKYIDIIKLKYFENKTQQDIADYFEKDTTTVWRNNKRLINEIKVYLFPNEVISEINCS